VVVLHAQDAPKRDSTNLNGRIGNVRIHLKRDSSVEWLEMTRRYSKHTERGKVFVNGSLVAFYWRHQYPGLG
jgi:hypothetical protein